MFVIFSMVILQMWLKKIEMKKILNEDEELNDIFKINENHASIVRIQQHVNIDSPFHFTNVSVKVDRA